MSYVSRFMENKLPSYVHFKMYTRSYGTRISERKGVWDLYTCV